MSLLSDKMNFFIRRNIILLRRYFSNFISSMKRILIPIFCCFCSFLAFTQSGKWFTVKGFLPQWNGADLSLFCNGQLLYSDKVIKDMFAYTGVIDKAMQGSIKVNFGRKSFYFPVFIEPGTIKIRDAGNKVLVPYGTPSNDIYVQLNKSFDSLATEQEIIGFSEALSFKRDLASSFVRHNPSSVVSVQLLKDYYYLVNVANDTVYHSLVHSLDTSLQQLSIVKEMIKEANKRFITAIGKPAPLLELPDSYGRTGPLFKTGQYTLIDFWASWCVPCRKENPAILNVFKKYQQEGFSISGVSLDINKIRWLNAIKQDQLPWQHLSDLKGWESVIVNTYGIKAIPMNYLINKEGIIIAKNLHASQLDALLNTLLLQPTADSQKTESQTLF